MSAAANGAACPSSARAATPRHSSSSWRRPAASSLAILPSGTLSAPTRRLPCASAHPRTPVLERFHEAPAITLRNPKGSISPVAEAVRQSGDLAVREALPNLKLFGAARQRVRHTTRTLAACRRSSSLLRAPRAPATWPSSANISTRAITIDHRAAGTVDDVAREPWPNVPTRTSPCVDAFRRQIAC